MSGITEIFLGITIVGIIMTVKVLMDGYRDLNFLKAKITALKDSTIDSQTQLVTQSDENKDIETALQEIKTEVEELSKKEKDMNDQITTLRTDLDGNKR
ncbi:MAG: hypothetical protein HOE48_16250 [Candidatus Latescibacteria bacterium]|jgi:chromosome segregation ATPase|nr:hypothetical protein [Candidatus Latescibacterota bacterium]MBT4139474.1 hypothetical protein [Candidatus Latescibacterota bacterium]